MTIYLRNLPTHTASTLLQKLNYVKQFQYSVVKQKFNVIHIICEKFRTIPLVFCKIQLIQFERVKIETHKIWNSNRLKFMCQWGYFNFVCRAEQTSFKKCMKFTVSQTSDSMTLSSVGQRLMFVFSWAHCGSTGFFSLAPTVSELRRIFFVSWHLIDSPWWYIG